MASTSGRLPISATLRPSDARELAGTLADAYGNATAVYPLGGESSIDFGIPATRPGVGVATTGLDQLIDYPARDMTITVESGIRIAHLNEVLRAERQEIPWDVPAAGEATVGGVIATNFNGARRYGCGAIRDHLIGITAVDGRGVMFHGGGRVVKNVAGYDFCKLLCGSLGTLAVITQVTLKVRPLPERRAWAAVYPDSLQQAEELLAALEHDPISPTAIELLGGREALIAPLDPDRKLAILVMFEGLDCEVNWSLGRLREIVGHAGIGRLDAPFQTPDDFYQQFIEFPARGGAAIVARGCLPPGQLGGFLPKVWQVDPDCSLQAHAGNGLFMLRMSRIPGEGLSRSFVAFLQAEARAHQGSLVILSNPAGVEVTRQSTLGGGYAPYRLMESVKRQFDPANILNPGRFMFP